MRTKARSPRHHQLLSLVLFELLARMALSSKEDIRRQLNLKNLQRHDPAIDRIVSSASYASVYDNKGDGWVRPVSLICVAYSPGQVCGPAELTLSLSCPPPRSGQDGSRRTHVPLCAVCCALHSAVWSWQKRTPVQHRRR